MENVPPLHRMSPRQISSCHAEDVPPANRLPYPHPAALRARGAVPGMAARGGLLGWRGALARFLVRPNDRLAARVERLKEAVGWRAGGRTVGLHIRRGDRMV